ncbi:hypothetical protein Poli38472_005137 [Pythium oligandrum]|uniref:ACB domain-containing protein n=1 Tax=Pythium oligandrum TaxID=41045 RepID=A0A8K1FIX2_PYTOL|nr:hypothetical protein Poli38472_005137 [Pythium oligandrum]|eukprot:TMW62519.1 hypothetical protein Poli38472_005137 [Pythium oligandrum]
MTMAMDWSWPQLALAALLAGLIPLALRVVGGGKTAKKALRPDALRTRREYMQEDGLGEVDATFQVAVDYVGTQPNRKLSNEQRLTMYAFYKQALLGVCTHSAPSAVDMVARAKWESWTALGSMAKDAAKRQYIGLVQELFPEFDVSGENHKTRTPHPLAEQIQDASTESYGMGGCTSMPTVDMTAPEWQVREDLFHFASTGEMDKIRSALDQGGDVDAKDEEGRTMLHWAVDRAQMDMVELLLKHEASPNVQDADGMTPLHYAVSCEDEALTKLLVEHGAFTDIADNDGETPVESASTDELQAILAAGQTRA